MLESQRARTAGSFCSLAVWVRTNSIFSMCGMCKIIASVFEAKQKATNAGDMAEVRR
jgi:hypothetical protein